MYIAHFAQCTGSYIVASSNQTNNKLDASAICAHVHTKCVCQARGSCKNAERALDMQPLHMCSPLSLYSAALNFLIIFLWNIIMRSRLCRTIGVPCQQPNMQKVYTFGDVDTTPNDPALWQQTCTFYGSAVYTLNIAFSVQRHYSRKADCDRHGGNITM